MKRMFLVKSPLPVLIAMLAIGIAGAAPVEEWNKTFGGSGEEIGFSVQQTTDGGYILVGHTSSTFKEEFADVWLVKTDAYGDEQWNKTFGGSGEEKAFSVQQTSDGGYIIAGIIISIEGYDALFIKTDSNGNQQWNKTIGGLGAHHAESVQQTSDGGYVLAGRIVYFGEDTGDVWLVKTDSNGNQQWSKAFGGIGDQAALSVQQTSDGGYIMAGVSDKKYALAIKTDLNGNPQWSKTFVGKGTGIIFSARQTPDGGYILTGGTSGPTRGPTDAWLIKIDPNGNQQWSKTFGGSGDDFARSVQQTSDGGYVLAGGTSSYGLGGYDAWLIKTDSSGNQLWGKTFGGSGEEIARSVQQTSDGGYILAGHTKSYGAEKGDMLLIKVSGEITPITTPTPGFRAVFAILGMLTVGYLMRRKWRI